MSRGGGLVKDWKRTKTRKFPEASTVDTEELELTEAETAKEKETKR